MLYREPPEDIWADDVDRRVQFGIDSGEPLAPSHPPLDLDPESSNPTSYTHPKGLASLLWSQVFFVRFTKTEILESPRVGGTC